MIMLKVYLGHVEYSDAGEADVLEFVEKDLLPVGVDLHPLLAVGRDHNQHLNVINIRVAPETDLAGKSWKVLNKIR